jgi:hypothetical protein
VTSCQTSPSWEAIYPTMTRSRSYPSNVSSKSAPRKGEVGLGGSSPSAASAKYASRRQKEGLIKKNRLGGKSQIEKTQKTPLKQERRPASAPTRSGEMKRDGAEPMVATQEQNPRRCPLLDEPLKAISFQQNCLSKEVGGHKSEKSAWVPPKTPVKDTISQVRAARKSTPHESKMKSRYNLDSCLVRSTQNISAKNHGNGRIDTMIPRATEPVHCSSSEPRPLEKEKVNGSTETSSRSMKENDSNSSNQDAFQIRLLRRWTPRGQSMVNHNQNLSFVRRSRRIPALKLGDGQSCTKSAQQDTPGKKTCKKQRASTRVTFEDQINTQNGCSFYHTQLQGQDSHDKAHVQQRCSDRISRRQCKISRRNLELKATHKALDADDQPLEHDKDLGFDSSASVVYKKRNSATFKASEISSASTGRMAMENDEAKTDAVLVVNEQSSDSNVIDGNSLATTCLERKPSPPCTNPDNSLPGSERLKHGGKREMPASPPFTRSSISGGRSEKEVDPSNNYPEDQSLRIKIKKLKVVITETGIGQKPLSPDDDDGMFKKDTPGNMRNDLKTLFVENQFSADRRTAVEVKQSGIQDSRYVDVNAFPTTMSRLEQAKKLSGAMNHSNLNAENICRADLGAKECPSCSRGPSYKCGHDVTCPKSQFYVATSTSANGVPLKFEPSKTGKTLTRPLQEQGRAVAKKPRSKQGSEGGILQECARWFDKFDDLCIFTSLFRTSTVADTFRDESLYLWSIKQREEYRRKQHKRKSSMTQERAVLLEKIGFIWLMANINTSEAISNIAQESMQARRRSKKRPFKSISRMRAKKGESLKQCSHPSESSLPSKNEANFALQQTVCSPGSALPDLL